MMTCRGSDDAKSFTACPSACAFLVNIYGKTNDQNKNSLRQILKSRDFTQALRYPAVLCEALPSNITSGDVATEILTQALQNDKDSAHLSFPACISVISGKLSDIEQTTPTIPIIKSTVEDGFWRIHSSLGNELPTIAKLFPVDSVMNDVGLLLLHLLCAPEAETKAAACRAISGILALLEQQEACIADKFLPEIDILTNDRVSQVRREAALRLIEGVTEIDLRVTNT
jgi:hypothetical protein